MLKVECLLNCPYCGNEIVSEDASFCPKCGKSLTPEENETQQNALEAPQKRTDLVLAAAILTMISAAFVAGIGYIGVYQYIGYIEFYDPALLLGFLIYGVDGIIAAAFALAGTVFMLKRKLFIFSTLGTIFPLVSVFVTLICVQHYTYGFTEFLLFTEISVAMLSVMSILLNFASRKEYK
jgi:nitrate reductase NapE component